MSESSLFDSTPKNEVLPIVFGGMPVVYVLETWRGVVKGKQPWYNGNTTCVQQVLYRHTVMGVRVPPAAT